MTFGKAAALTAAFVGVFALGVVTAPYISNHTDIRPDRTATVNHDAPAANTSATPASSTRRARQSVKTEIKTAEAPAAAPASAIAAVPATTPELQGRLKKVLRSGAKMDLASNGFRNGEQFAMVAHASRNTDVPFMLLKHRVVEEGKSLEAALRESKPDIDASAEVSKAREQARADLASVDSGN
jgi:hypothetical protein